MANSLEMAEFLGNGTFPGNGRIPWVDAPRMGMAISYELVVNLNGTDNIPSLYEYQ